MGFWVLSDQRRPPFWAHGFSPSRCQEYRNSTKECDMRQDGSAQHNIEIEALKPVLWPTMQMQRVVTFRNKTRTDDKSPGINGYGSIPMKIPFLVGWTSIYQLFWCELQGYKVLTHCQMTSLRLLSPDKNPSGWCSLLGSSPVFCSPLQDSLDALSCQQALGRHERCGDYDQPCPAWLDISTFSGDLMFLNHVKTLTLW